MTTPQTADLVLALDSGSQSSRALLFDASGAVLAQGQHAHEPMKHPEEGAVEQDPLDIRRCLFRSIADCLAAWGGDASRIRAAALTTQRNTILPADAEGAPLCDAVSWLDRRAASSSSEPSRALRAAWTLLGDESLLPRLLSKSVARQWRERRPELLRDAAWIVPLEAWLTHQLTGEMAMAPGGMVGVWPANAKARGWERGGPIYKLLAFEARWLARIVEAGQRVGTVTAAAAAETGLPEGTPLYACGGDKQAEALGAGVRLGRRGVAQVSLGTASSISMPWAKPNASMRYHWLTMASCEPGSWHLEYMVYRGMWTAAWFARQLGRDLAPLAAERGVPVEALLCEEAEAVPAGSDGVMTWPRWSPSLQNPGETGTVTGLKETHTRGHLFRSLLEGIAFDLRRGLETLEDATGQAVHEIRVGGGGSRSDVVVSILTDVLGRAVLRPASAELAARGAALVAAAGSGLHGSLDAAVAAMVPVAPRTEPDPARKARYDRMYREVFLPGLDDLAPTFKAMARLR